MRSPVVSDATVLLGVAAALLVAWSCSSSSNAPASQAGTACTSAAGCYAGTTDPTTFCQRFANAGFTCRSTGGGANNRKFCGP